MAFQPPVTRKDAVAAYLRESILSGRLAPGTIIKDAIIAAEVGVSITPVREAVSELEREGWIVGTSNRRRHVFILTEDQGLELIDAMGVVLDALLRRALPRLEKVQSDELAKRLDAFALAFAPNSPTARKARAFKAFHSYIADIAGQAELAGYARSVGQKLDHKLRVYPREDLSPLYVAGATAAAKAFHAGDAEAGIAAIADMFAKLTVMIRDTREAPALPAAASRGGALR